MHKFYKMLTNEWNPCIDSSMKASNGQAVKLNSGQKRETGDCGIQQSVDADKMP